MYFICFEYDRLFLISVYNINNKHDINDCSFHTHLNVDAFNDTLSDVANMNISNAINSQCVINNEENNASSINITVEGYYGIRMLKLDFSPNSPNALSTVANK